MGVSHTLQVMGWGVSMGDSEGEGGYLSDSGHGGGTELNGEEWNGEKVEG